MIAADSVLLGASALASACALLETSRAALALTIDQMLERDRRSCPAPSRSVLVLDDSPAVRLATVHALAALGVPVLEAASTSEARVAIRQSRPAAIVADYHLGTETCLALLRDRPAFCRAVIVSGRVDLATLAPLARAVSADLRGRPLDLDEERDLCDLVRSYLPEAV